MHYLKNYNYSNFEKSYLFHQDERNKIQKLIYDAKLKKIKDAKIIIIGDSYAEDVYLGLLHQYSSINESDNNKHIFFIYFDTVCYSEKEIKNTFKEILKIHFNLKFEDNCTKQINYFNKTLNEIDYLNLQFIIISNQWKTNTIGLVSNIINRLSSFPENKIIFMRNNITFNKYEELLPYSKSPENFNKKLYFYLDRDSESLNEIIQKKLKKNMKFFTYDLCSDFLETCNVFNPKTLTLTHRDTGHYTLGYSKKLASLLKKKYLQPGISYKNY